MDSYRVATDAAAFRDTARNAPAGVRVPVEVRVDVADPWVAYRRARRGDGAWGVFFETTGVDGAEGVDDGWGYFAVDPVERFTARPDAIVLVDGDGQSVEPNDDDQGVASSDDDQGVASSDDDQGVASGDDERVRPGASSQSLQALEALVDATDLVRGGCDVPFPCGAFGWLSYDLARELEALPASARDDRDLPHVQVGVYDRVVAWRASDAASEGATTLSVTACPELPEAGETLSATALEELHAEAVARAGALADRATTGDPAHGPAPAAAATEAAFESDTGREAYADRVRAVKACVRDGDTFQANVSHRLRAPAAVHPVAAYDALRRVNPAPYSGLVEFPGVDLVSASPELLLERDGEFVRTEPIAGTRPRGADATEDAALAAELGSDEKERAEHAMLVDLERNDLGKVSAYGTVDVAEYRRIDRYSEVMHLVSDVTGSLPEGVGLADAVGAMFPGGTITGAPKPRTMEIIEELESTRRGPYTGAMAAVGFDDRATLNIVIRTLVRHGDEYHLRVGAGIVHDSEPAREYDETLAKARALLNAVDDALDADANLELEDEAA